MGSMAANMLPMTSLPPTDLFLSRRTGGVPQKVKNNTASIPMATATAPVAITGTARTLSGSPLKHGQLVFRGAALKHLQLRFERIDLFFDWLHEFLLLLGYRCL